MSKPNDCLHIVLIHGTWGRGFFKQTPAAKWCEEGSEFRTELSQKLQLLMPNFVLRFHVFNWSGTNSVFARLFAARALRTFINNHVPPADKAVLVAHSHGGNVALQAVSMSERRERLYLVSLATPFLKITVTNRVLKDSWFALAAALFVAATPLAPHVKKLLWSVQMSAQARSNVIVLMIYAFGALLFYLCYLIDRWVINPRDDGRRSSHWQRRPQRLARATQYSASRLGERFLILRGIDDEAALSLVAGSIANRLSSLIFESFTRIGMWLGIAVFLFAFILLFLTDDYAQYWMFGFIAAFSIFALAGVALTFPALARLPFGREFILGTSRCDVFTDSVPDCRCAEIVTKFNGPLTNAGLVHSMHERSDVRAEIARWISETYSNNLR